MNELKRSAILLSLIEHLRAKRSWCGETHVQKASFFLQTLLGVPLNFDFILYKYGPYSFDLTDELVAMRSDSLLRLISNEPYGPTLSPGDSAEQIKKRFPVTIEKFADQIEFVAEKLGDKQVSELEALSTALYVWLNEGEDVSNELIAFNLQQLKPHIEDEFAATAVREMKSLVSDAQKYQIGQEAIA